MRVNQFFKFCLYSVLTLFFFVSSASFAAVRYMRPGGTGNGSSWATASADFNAMMTASVAGDQIWIAEGEYLSATTFVGKAGVSVYGGFPATGTPNATTQAKPQNRFSILKVTTSNLVAQLRNGEQYWSGVTLTIQDGEKSPYEAIQLGNNAELDYCRIIDNYNDRAGAGLIWMNNNAKITNSLVANNNAGGQANLFTVSSDGRNCILENSIIVNNRGHRFKWYDMADFTMLSFVGCIIANNSFNSFTNGYNLYSVWYYNTVIWGNPYGGWYQFRYCAITPGYESARVANSVVLSTNNNAANGPQFRDPTTTVGVIVDRNSADYAKVANFSSWRVKPGSVLLKRGIGKITNPRNHPLAPDDILGEPRDAENACGVDIGPYSFTTAEYTAVAVVSYSPTSKTVCHTGQPIPISGITVTRNPNLSFSTIYKNAAGTVLTTAPQEVGTYQVTYKVNDGCYAGESTPHPYTILPTPNILVTAEGGGVNTCCFFGTEHGLQIPNTDRGIKIDIFPLPTDVANVSWSFTKTENRILLDPFNATTSTPATSPSILIQPFLTKTVAGPLTTTITAIANAGMCAPNLRKTFDITVYDPPTVQIVDNATSIVPVEYVCSGVTPTLKANLVGSGNYYGTPKYQWSVNGVDVAGAISQTYTLSAFTAETGIYRCNITYANGFINPIGTAVTLKQKKSPVIESTNPSGLLTVGSGSSRVLTVTAGSTTLNSGENLQYQWQQSTALAGPYTNVMTGSGATTASYTTPNLSAPIFYKIVVTDPKCSTLKDEKIIEIKIGISITTEPTDQIICAGSSATFFVAATASGIRYQWQYTNNKNDGTSWQDVAGATNTTLSVTPEANRNHYYRCGIKGAGSETDYTYTNIVEAKVVTPPVIDRHPVGGSGCAGQSFPLSVIATSTGTLTYQWQKLTNTVWGNALGTSTTATYSATTPALGVTEKYRCVITASPCLPAVISNETSITGATTVTFTRNLRIQEEFCKTNPLTLEVLGSTTVTYQWQKRTSGLWSSISGATAATYIISTESQLGTYRCVITPTNCGSAVTSNTCDVVLGTAPRITTQPIHGTVCSTQPYYRLTLEAEGNNLTYVWYKVVGSIPTPVLGSGSSNNYFDLYSDIPGTYRCQVSNGCGSVWSDDFTIVVGTEPTIVSPPTSIQVCSGSSATVSVTAAGSLLMTYQWEESTDGTTYSDVVGATTARYIISNVTGSKFYRCKVIGCGATTTSSAALVSVGSAPLIVTQPRSGSICGTGSYVLNIVADGAMPLAYQWQRQVSGAWVNIDGENATNLQVSNITTTTQYRCLVYGCGTVVSNVASVQVDSRPLIQTQPLSKVVCPNTTAVLNVVATGLLSPIYRWEISNNGSTWLATGTNSAQLTTAQINALTYYRVTVSGTDPSCGTTPSDIASVTPLNMLTITHQPVSGTICTGGTHLLSVMVDMSEVTYQWSRNGVDIAGATSSSYSAMQVGEYKCIIKNSCEQQATSSTVTVALATQPNILHQPNGGAICAGEVLSLSVAASGSTVLNYQWQSSLGGGNWTNVPDTDGGISPALNIAWSAGLPTLYKCNITAPNCGTITTNIVTVSPGSAPRILTNPVGGTVCRNGSHIFNVAVDGGAVTHYQWQRLVSAGNYTDIPGATSSTYTMYNITANTTLRCKVYNTCGDTYSTDAALVVTTSPTILVQPKSARICVGETHELSVNVNVSLVNYDWQESLNGGVWTSVGTSSTYAVTQPNNNKRYKAVVTPIISGCISIESQIVTVKEGMISTAMLPSNGSICSGGRFDLEITDGGSDYAKYQWIHDGANIIGATMSTYAVTEIGTYTCKVTNSCGTTDVGPTVIGTTDQPIITRQPVGGLDCDGSGLTLSVVATGAQPISYQWKLNNNNIIGANNNTYVVNGISTQGTYFVSIVGCGETVSSEEVTVKPSTRPIIDRQPIDGTYCSGNVFNTGVVLRGDPADYLYQWEKQQVDGSWSNVEGAISANIAIGEIGRYRCTISNACGRVNSSEIFVRLGSVPTILNTAQSVTLCSGETTTFTIDATGSTDYSYQWRSSNDGSTWIDIAGATTADHTITFSNPKIYQCLVGAGGCLSKATSPRFTVSQGDLPTITMQPVGGSRCNVSTAFDLTVAALPVSATYQWGYSSTIAGTYTAVGTSATHAAVADGFYKVTITNGCGNVTSNTVEVKTGTFSIIKQPESIRLCPGEFGELSVGVAGSTATYQWQKLNSANTWENIATTATLPLGYSNVPASYKVRVTGCNSTTIESTVVNYSPGYQPTINTQPQSGSVCLGGSYPLSVIADGSDDLSYLWQVQNGGTWTDIPVSNMAEYTINNVTLSSVYRVKVMNNCGEKISDRATVSISSVPTIIAQPQDASTCTNSSVTLSVGVRGSGLETYAWESSTNGYSFAAISGATSSTYTTPLSTTATTFYQCKIKGSSSTCGSVTSDVAEVKINNTPVVITHQPVGGTVCSDGSFTVHVEATGSGTLSYQWKNSGTNIALATSSSYTISGAGSLTCEITSSCGNTITSAPAVVTIGSKPSIVTQPLSDVEVCSGDNYELSVIATGGSSLSYQWQRYSSDGSWLNEEGQNASKLRISEITTAVSYRVVISSLGCTETVTSTTSNVSKGGIPVITKQPVDGSISICDDGGLYHSTVVAEGSSLLNYQWQEKFEGRWNNIYNANNSFYNITKAGNYQVKVSNGCGTNYTHPFVVVPQGLSILEQPVDAEVCTSSNATFSVLATGARVLTYQWEGNTGTGFSPILGATSSSYTALSPSTGSYYRVKISTSNPNCSGIVSDSVTVKAVVGAPIISSQPIGGTFCGDSKLKLSVGVTGTTSHTYQWQKETTASSGGFADIVGATSSSVLVSEGKYQCLVTTCFPSTKTDVVTVTRGSSPTITTSPVAQTTLCLGETATLSAEVTGASLINYQWYKVVGTEHILIPSAQDKRYTVVPTVAGTTTYFLRADATPSGCGILDTRSVDIVVRPKTKIISDLVSGSMCSGQTYTLSTAVEPAIALQSIKWYIKDETDPTVINWLELEGETSLQLTLSGFVNRQTYKAILNTDCGELTTKEVAVWQSNTPTITLQPQSAQLCQSASYSMNVAVTGLDNPLYQWQYLDGIAWSNISEDGNTTELYVNMSNNTRLYRCVISSDDPSCESTASNTATLQLGTTPIIVSQSPTGTALPKGEYALFVDATGSSDMNYQWQKHNGTDWEDILGATQRTYTAKNLPEVVGTSVSYRCVIDNNCGILYGSQILVTIGNQLTITQQPQSFSICDGDDVVLKTQATGSSDILYQWESSLNRTTWSNVSIGGENSQLHVRELEQLTYYRCKISSIKLGTGYQLYSREVQVSIGRSPIITMQPTGGYMCANGTFEMSFVVAESNAYYQWQYKDGGVWVDLSNANSTQYTIDNLTTTTVYRSVVSNGCGVVITNPVTVQLSNQPTIVSEPKSVVACASERVTLTAKVTGGTVYSYSWDNSADGETWSAIQGGNQKEYITSPTSSPLFYRVNITSQGCGSVTSKPASVSNFSGLTIERQPKGGTSCLNGKFILSTTVSGSATIGYQWQKKVGDGRWENIRGAQTYYYVETITETSQYRCLLSTICLADPIRTNEITVTVADAPTILEQPQGATLCTEPHTMDFVVSGASGFTYQWESSGDGRVWAAVEGATNASYTVVGNNETKMYRVSATPLEQTCGFVTSEIATIWKGFEPIVTLPSHVLVCKNSSYTIQSSLDGSSNANYLWQQFVGGVWKNIEGEVHPDLQLNYVTASSSYRLRVSNGCGTTVSNTVLVSVGTVPTIVSSPSSITVCEGQGTTLDVSAVGSLLLNYQWQKSTDDGLNWSGIDKATTSKLNIPLVEGATLYRCLVSGLTANCGSVNSAPAKVSVQQAEELITISEQPVGGTVCVGNDYQLRVVQGGFMTLTYQWQVSFDGELFEDIQGATKAIYVVRDVNSDGYYRCVLSSCGTILESAVAQIIVSNVPTITLHPQSGTICAEESYPLRVHVTGINLPNYQWKYSTDMQSWMNIVDATNNIYVANFTQDKLYFQCEIRQGACGPVTTATAVVSKVNNIVITQQPVGGTMCENSTFKLRTASNIPDAIYQWQEKFGDWFDIAGGNAQEYQLPAFGKGSREVRCLVSIPDSRCQSMLTNSVTVSSSNKPSFIVQPLDQQVCVGQTVTLFAEATGTATTTYQWQKTTDGQTWTDVPESTTGSLSVVMDVLPQAYRCIIPNNGETCQEAVSQVATCSFGGNPEIVNPLVGGTVCDVADKFMLSIGVTGRDLKYTWEKSDNGTDWQALLADTEQATYEVAAGFSYRVIVKNGCGEVTSNVVSVSTGGVTIVQQPQPISLCDGEAGILSIGVTGAINIGLQWQKLVEGNWTNVFGATQSTLSVHRAEELTQYRCEVKACDVTIFSEPAFAKPGTIPTIITQPVGGAMCVGEKFVLDVTADQVEHIDYVWQYKQNNVWTNVSGVSGKQLTISTLPKSTFYRVIVKNGCGADTSRSSVLVFNANVPSIIKHQSDIIACPEEQTRLEITATGANVLRYQWQKYDAQWTDVANEVSSSLVVGTWSHGDKYRCIVSGGSDACGSINSREILLTEGSVPEIVQQPLSGTMCTNGQYPLSVVTKEGQKVTYQWQSATTGATLVWIDLSGATSAVYNVVSGSGSRYYRVLITNGCGITTSQEVIVSESNIPTLVVSPQSGTICHGAAHTLEASVAGSKNFSYQWQSSIDGVVWLDVLGANTSSYTFKPTVTSNYRFVAVPAEDKCFSIVTPKIKVDVLPGATIVSQPKELIISCLSYDAQVGIQLASTENITYRWQQYNGSVWKNLTDAAYAEAVYEGTEKDTLEILGTSVMGSFEYRVSLINTTNQCQIHSEPALLLVVPSTIVSITPLENTMNRPEDQVILNSVLSGGAAEISYQWLAGTSPDNVIPIADNIPKGASYLDFNTETLQFTGIETTKKLYYKLKISAPNCPDAYSNAVTVSLPAQHIEVVGAQVITPNGDGLNDVLKHPFYGTESIELRILNRRGSLVYENKNYDETFSAAGLPQGVYFYSYKVNYEDNRTEYFQGTVTVIN